MKFYSTNGQAPVATLEKAVVKGLAEDKGLYMPERIKPLPKEFFDNIEKLSFQEIAYQVADAFFGEDVPAEDLKRIVYDTLAFDCPCVKVTDSIYSLELFHGPTLAFKDVGARFMARLLQYFLKKEGSRQVNVLVATSGDTGSAVANGFLAVDGIHVYVLYPKGKVSPIQECQFTTLGKNITAVEVDGVFDDCQALVKNAFMDADLNEPAHEVDLCELHQCGTFPSTGILLFLCIRSDEETWYGRSVGGVCAFRQFWQHLLGTLWKEDGASHQALHCCQ